jgi:hypothetical protein
MPVVSFSTARFTPDDIARFNAIAAPRLKSGLWAGVKRRTTPAKDVLAVVMPVTGMELFTFERGHDGSYGLFMQEGDGPYRIGAGGSAMECLAIWLIRERRLGGASDG